MYFVAGVFDGGVVGLQGLVVGLEELEGLGHTRHGLGGTLDNLDELFEGALIVGKEELSIVVNLLLKLLILDTLHEGTITRSSSFCSFFLSWSFFLSSGLGWAFCSVDIQK